MNKQKDGTHILYYNQDDSSTENKDSKRYVKKYNLGQEVHLYSDYEDPITEDELDEQTTTHYHKNGQVKYERKGTCHISYHENKSISLTQDIPKTAGQLAKYESFYDNGQPKIKGTYISRA